VWRAPHNVAAGPAELNARGIPTATGGGRASAIRPFGLVCINSLCNALGSICLVGGPSGHAVHRTVSFHRTTAVGHERRIRANAPAAGRPRPYVLP
jgi:hypothetical protein